MSSNIIASIQPAKEKLVNLLQEINQNPKQWRQFWSSFDAAVHSQAIPDIQKLNYLYSCFKGNALQVVSGYDIVPENYGVIRRLLKEKYGKSSMITTILYKKLQSIIKGNERDWKKVIENIERVLRQLEALGEEMEHSSIENLIEGKLPRWILNKLYEQKKAERTWSTSKLRELLLEVANMDEQVSKVLNLSTQAESKPTTTKFGQKQRYNPEETSALSTIRSNPKVPQPATNKKRLDCDDYPTAKTRMYHLKRLKKCSICFRDNHKSEACKVKKQCFHCKGSHNSALYEERNIISSETLLLCRGINVFNPKQPQRKLKALALFDIGSQLSFISRKLSHQLGLSESEN
uniref:Peptidase aspartic putative domain-containing protein n=1 Tax=Wuchereria bancrofti TaxID=6293 RepID=A0AAF5RWJ4_WUCBA